MGNRSQQGTSGALRGRPLRYLVVAALIEADGPCSVSELVAVCERQGVAISGRPSKVISDALRWEIDAGRVRRVRRGVYAVDHVPKSTRGWIRQRNAQTRAWLAWSAAQPGSVERVSESAPPDLEVGWVPPWPSLPSASPDPDH